MNFILLVFLLSNILKVASSNQTAINYITCEKITVYKIQQNQSEAPKACFMGKNNTIQSPETEFVHAEDICVTALTFASNKGIFFLPLRVSKSFPNLERFVAYQCSLSTIIKLNFENLHRLKVLNLGANQIETFANDVFDDLKALEELDLSWNKIQFVNGQAFNELPNIKKVWLYGNKCINKNFDEKYKIKVMSQSITEKCGLSESCSLKIRDHSDVVKKSLQESEKNQTSQTLEVMRKSIRIEFLEDEVKALKIELRNTKAAKQQIEIEKTKFEIEVKNSRDIYELTQETERKLLEMIVNASMIDKEKFESNLIAQTLTNVKIASQIEQFKISLNGVKSELSISSQANQRLVEKLETLKFATTQAEMQNKECQSTLNETIHQNDKCDSDLKIQSSEATSLSKEIRRLQSDLHILKLEFQAVKDVKERCEEVSRIQAQKAEDALAKLQSQEGSIE